MNIDLWLEQSGLAQYSQLFRANDIDLSMLGRLSDADLKEIGIASFGHRKAMLNAIAVMASMPPAFTTAANAAAGPALERRQLTVLFTDLVGSTALSTRLDPEDLRELIRNYQNAAAGEIARFEGHIAQFLGDGVLAYFGWPRAHEDDAERAVRAGLGISRTVSQLSTPAGEQLQTRIGISTGLVVVGDLIGEGAGQQHAVVGETPNLAARLQGVVGPGKVVISESTRHLVGDLFTLRDLGAQNLKGIARQSLAFEVLSERTLPSRFAARHAGVVAPIVGRETELAILSDCWQRATAGVGQIVLLSGEAGIGKSRVAEAVIETAGRNPHFLVRYQCSPYHTDSALYPVAQHLARTAGFTVEDTQDEQLDRLEALLAKASGDIEDGAPLAAALLGLDGSSRYAVREWTPQERRQRTRSVLIEQLASLAGRQPVLWLIEDAHWIDPTTLDLIEHALDAVRASRVLLLVTSRPTFVASFAEVVGVTTMQLAGVDRAATQAIIARVTRGKALPAAVVNEIASKTDGMPLFVEEITKTVIESGALREDAQAYRLDGPLSALTIPATLQDSLMARLDRLAPLKALAQLAATIGREFSYSLLRAVSPGDEAGLRRQLTGLVDAELIYQHGTPPQATYTFKHALIQETAYLALLKTTRRQYHRRIGEVMAQQFSEMAALHPEVLAHHFTQAGLAAEAIDHWKRAGEHALDKSAYQEAIGHLTQGLELVPDLTVGVDRLKSELELQVAIAPALDATKGVSSADVQHAYGRAWEICLELGDSPLVFSVLMGLRRFYFVRGELARARSVAEQLLTLARRSGDRMQLIETNLGFGATSLWRGELSEALLHLEQGAAHFNAGTPVLVPLQKSVKMSDPLVSCLAYSSWAQWVSGFPHGGLIRSHQALEYARQLDHPISIALALDFAAALREFRGEAREALALSEEGIELCKRHGFNFWLSLLTVRRGWALAHLGKVASGLEETRRGIDIWKQTGAGLARPFLLVLLSEVLVHAGLIDEARDRLDEAIEDGEQREECFFEAEVHRLSGELQILAGRRDRAEASFHRALDVAIAQGSKSLALRAAVSLTHHGCLSRRPPIRTGELLANLYAEFTEGHDTRDLAQARKLLAG